jgi:dipeptidyl aminopeptidase/acylaminoacyl peptidase
VRRALAQHRRRAVAACLIAIAALLALYGGLAIYKARDYTTTPRQPAITTSPAAVGLAFQSVRFDSAANDGVQLAGWWIPNPASTRAIILVHGRYENRASHLALARPFFDAGYSVLLFDLRGHGESTRATCTYGVKESEDVVGAMSFVEAQGVTAGQIGVIGWSLGAASALLAMDRSPDIAAVVSDSAYADSSPLLARNALRPGLKLAMRLTRGVNLNDVRPDRALAHVAATSDRHVLLIHGALDNAVPVAQFEQLRAAGGAAVADAWLVPDAGHTGAYAADPDAYIGRVLAFFGREFARTATAHVNPHWRRALAGIS